ncbi:MAG: hypothetical protein ACRELB_05785, partial [Polyangiaceae bacterium]
MNLRALREDSTPASEGNQIRSWVEDYPREEQNDSGALSSGVKDVGPDDTMEQPEAPRHVRRSTGPRKRVALRADSVRDALEVRYRREGQWDELVELYMGRIEVVEDPEKVELYKRLGDVLWQELGDSTAARLALVEALAIDPTDDDAAAQAEDVAASSDRG